MSSEGTVASELSVLRKGRGLVDVRLRDRIGPELSSIMGLTGSMTTGQVRLIATRLLQRNASQLPDYFSIAIDAMFGLTPGFYRPTLQERQEMYASRFGCNFRTARRRCEEALQLLAEQLVLSADEDGSALDTLAGSGTAAADRVFAADTWYTERLTALVRHDRDHPEVREERCIVANTPQLSEVTASTGFLPVATSGAATVFAEIDYGALLLRDEGLPGGIALTHMKLPRALSAGERHWYGRTVRLASVNTVERRALFRPSQRCDSFMLRVRFSLSRVPNLVRIYDGILDPEEPIESVDSDCLSPDAAGEVCRTFTGLAIGHTYGFIWSQ